MLKRKTPSAVAAGAWFEAGIWRARQPTTPRWTCCLCSARGRRRCRGRGAEAPHVAEEARW